MGRLRIEKQEIRDLVENTISDIEAVAKDKLGFEIEILYLEVSSDREMWCLIGIHYKYKDKTDYCEMLIPLIYILEQQSDYIIKEFLSVIKI